MASSRRRRLEIEATMDTKGVKVGAQQVGQETGKMSGQVSKHAGAIKGQFLAMGAALGAGAIIKFGVDAVGAFSDLEESVNAVNVMYGEAAEGVHDLGVDSAEAFGLSTTKVNEAAVGLGAFVTKIDEADPADAFKNIIQRATDFGSVMNITTEETLVKFRSGLAGESEPLKAFGVDLSAATVEQTALRLGIIETGEKMTENQKVMARYETIMEQTANTAGDFANTSGGLAGQQKILTAKWEEAQVVLGEQLAPVMQQLITAAIDLIPLFTTLAGGVGFLVEEAGPAIQIFSELATLVGGFGEAAGDAEEPTGAMGDAINILKEAAGNVFNPLGMAMEASQDFSAAVGLIPDDADKARVAVEDWAEELDTTRQSSEELADKLDRRVTPAVDDFGEAVEDVEEEADDAAAAVRDLKDSAADLAQPVLSAKDALIKLEEVLVDVQEDGDVTEQEFDEVVAALGRLQTATDDLDPDNIEAYSLQGQEVLGLLDEATTVTRGKFTGLSNHALAELSRTRAGMDLLFDKTLQVEIRARAPSSSEMDRLVRSSLTRLGFRGVFPN